MTFAATAPASAFSAALSLAALAANRKISRKLDTPVRMIARNGTLTFVVTEPFAGITITTTAAAKIISGGEVAVSANRLDALLSGFAGGTAITICANDKAATISGGNSVYRLALCPDPPAAHVIDPETGRIELRATDCMKLLEVLPAVGTEQSRFFLCGAYLCNVADKLIAVATNGVRLLRVSIAADHFSEDDRLIIPTPAATMLVKIIRKVRPDTVMLRRSRTLFAASAPGFEIVARLVDAAYPDYQRVLPRAGDNSVVCQRSELSGALARLEAVAIGELVRLSWDADDGALLLSLPQQPSDGADVLAAQAKGSANAVFALPLLSAMVDEFNNDTFVIEAVERGLLIRQAEKLGVVMTCHWPSGNEKQGEAIALSA